MKYLKLILLLAILLLTALQIHNLFNYPLTHGFDAIEHINYIRFIQLNHYLPLPDQGWETYHPPLYYLMGAVLPNLELIKIINLLSWLSLGFVGFILFSRVFSSKIQGLLGSMLVISLPAVIYITPQISNEIFSGALISASMVYYFFNKKDLRGYRKITLGVLLGLSLLAKATAILLLAAILIDQTIDKRFDLYKVVKYLLPVFLIAVMLGGWFYMRNNLLYGNPLVSNLDFVPDLHSQSSKESGFWFDMSVFGKMDLFHAHERSFLGGVYFSLFYDGQNSLIPVQEFSRAGNWLILASIPLFFTSLFGFIKSVSLKSANIFVIYTILILISLVLYNLKYPYQFSSAVKGIYIISMVIPWTYFLLYGFKYFNKFLIILYLDLALYEALIIKNFWILKSWY